MTEDNPELRRRTIALVGLMGAGKSTIGRRLAQTLDLPFKDADTEIELAAGCTINEIFAALGEPAFRAGEQRVIARLLSEPPHVLATGGGAFTNPENRRLFREQAITVWLKTDLEVLARRVGRRDTRPLLRGRDPMDVLRAQAEIRYPFYEEANVMVEIADGSQQSAVEAVLAALRAYVKGAP